MKAPSHSSALSMSATKSSSVNVCNDAALPTADGADDEGGGARVRDARGDLLKYRGFADVGLVAVFVFLIGFAADIGFHRRRAPHRASPSSCSSSGFTGVGLMVVFVFLRGVLLNL